MIYKPKPITGVEGKEINYRQSSKTRSPDLSAKKQTVVRVPKQDSHLDMRTFHAKFGNSARGGFINANGSASPLVTEKAQPSVGTIFMANVDRDGR